MFSILDIGNRKREVHNVLTDIDNVTRQEFEDIKDTINLPEKIKLSGFKNSSIKPLVTFISDDGHRGDLEMLELFNSKGIKAGTAMISEYIGKGNYMTDIELKSLSEAGWDIMLHDTIHRDMTTLNETELRNAMKKGKDTIESLGIPCNGIVMPYGKTNSLIKRVSEEYFDFNFGENLGRVNYQPIITYNMQRINHGGDGQTLTHYKNGVNNAIATNGWCIFCTHYYQLTSEQKTELAELIDWIKEKDVDIVNVSEGMDIFGNVLEYRNYDTSEYSAITSDGKILSSSITKSIELTPNSVTYDMTPSLFPIDTTSYCNFNNNTLGFPFSKGRISTYRSQYKDLEDYTYQIIYPSGTDGNIPCFRQWDKSKNEWGTLVSLGSSSGNSGCKIISDVVNTRSNTDSITTYEDDSITVTPISNSFASTQDFPEGRGGTLITYKIGPNLSGLQYQTYTLSASGRIFIRTTTDTDTWRSWMKQGGYTKFDRTVPDTTIQANTSVDFEFEIYKGVDNSGALLHCTPQSTLINGIMYNVLPSSTKAKMIIRLANITLNSIDFPSTVFSLWWM